MSTRAAGILLAVLLAICGLLGWRIWSLTNGSLTDGIAGSAVPATAPDASQAFLRSWDQSSSANYFASARVGLTGNNGLEAFSEDIVVQRNGQRLVNREGSIIYERDGHTETCRQTQVDLFCTPEAPIPSVKEELAEIAALTVGVDRSYTVTFGGPGCFELAQDPSKGPVVPKFGVDSTYCFHGGTGALEYSDVRRPTRTDSYRASDISNSFEESDLRGLFPEPIIDRFFQ